VFWIAEDFEAIEVFARGDVAHCIGWPDHIAALACADRLNALYHLIAKTALIQRSRERRDGNRFQWPSRRRTRRAAILAHHLKCGFNARDICPALFLGADIFKDAHTVDQAVCLPEVTGLQRGMNGD